jgi:diguanylate cyclase (GGDEF)-like protein/PAS domain S-box-containing protein
MNDASSSFQTLFQGNPLPMWVVHEASQRIVAVNKAAQKCYGYDEGEFLALQSHELRPVEEQEAFKRFAATGKLSQGSERWTHVKADGSRFWITAFGQKIVFEGEAARLIVIVDVSLHKAAEDRLIASKRLTDAALDNMSQGLLMFDATGKMILHNNRYLEIYKLPEAEVQAGMTMRELLELRSRLGSLCGSVDRYLSDLSNNVVGGQRYERSVLLPDGRSVHVVTSPLPGGGWVVTHEDVTTRLRFEQALVEKKSQLDAALQNMAQGLCMFDADGKIILFNEQYRKLMGLSREFIESNNLLAVLRLRRELGELEEDPDELYSKIVTNIREGHASTRILEGRLGTRMRVVDQPMLGGGWVSTFEDITKWHEAQQRIEFLARYDPITHLPNRTCFSTELNKAIESARVSGHRLAVLTLDLDRFKEINDAFGHAAGDAVLRHVARRLNEVAAGGYISRFGGDEFCIFVSEGGRSEAAKELAHALSDLANDDISIMDQTVRTGFSIGISYYPDDAVDAESLLARSDAALYQAKRDAKGSIRYFEPEMDRKIRDKRLLQNELRIAVGSGQLRLYYQPQFLPDQSIAGFEALLRWEHPTRGLLGPADFIPASEDSGIILKLGEWALREACREASVWKAPHRIAVNISPIQFQQGDLPGLVLETLLETGLVPHRLELEVTEGVLISDYDRALSILRRLKSLNIRIALDDFGTGYSSLSYLQAFPFDKIKIDRTFVANVARNPQSAAIVRAVIGLARGLRLPVTAEGIETREQLEFLLNEGCDELQGYLLGRPLPIHEFSSLTDDCREQVSIQGSFDWEENRSSPITVARRHLVA